MAVFIKHWEWHVPLVSDRRLLCHRLWFVWKQESWGPPKQNNSFNDISVANTRTQSCIFLVMALQNLQFSAELNNVITGLLTDQWCSLKINVVSCINENVYKNLSVNRTTKQIHLRISDTRHSANDSFT